MLVMITMVVVATVMAMLMLMVLTKSNLSWRLSIGGSLSCSASHPRDLVSHHRLGLRGDQVHFCFFATFCIFEFIKFSHPCIGRACRNRFLMFLYLNEFIIQLCNGLESPFCILEWKYLF